MALPSNRHEYQEYFLRGKGGRGVGLTTLPPSCADCLEVLGSSTSWNPQDLPKYCLHFSLNTIKRLVFIMQKFIAICSNAYILYKRILCKTFVNLRVTTNVHTHGFQQNAQINFKETWTTEIWHKNMNIQTKPETRKSGIKHEYSDETWNTEI
jgi:hypothetical protein